MEQSILTLDNIVNYLFDKKLIDEKSVIQADLKIIDESRRNRNFKVMRRNSSSYLIKQSIGNDRYDRNTLETESKFYSYVARCSTCDDHIKSFIPKFYFHDDVNKILVIQYIKNSISLNQYIRNSSKDTISVEPFYLLGKNIASYHSFFESHVNKNLLDFIRKQTPPSLFFVRPHPSIFSHLSSANLRLIKSIQKYPDMISSLESIYKDWKVQTLVHSDMKWDNIVISDVGFKTSNTYVVDWELASLGDPAWDIAGILHDFIAYWIGFIFSSEITNIDDLTIPAGTPSDSIKDHIRLFWMGYIKTRNLDSKESNELLRKSVKYCASRLIQKSYEMHQYSSSLSSTAYYMVQVSANIMKDTENAIIHLFGIPFRFVG
jgi:5-methylthioribose kinase